MARKPRFTDALKGNLQVAYLPLTEIAPSERNARTHSKEQIAQLVASISEFGWTNPILIDEDRAIIAGHGRLEAARAAGLPDVPTITLTGLSAAQKRALAIADNKLALNAGWDDEMLRVELSDLGVEGFDLGLIGFSKMELDQILAPDIDPRDEWQGMPEFEQGDMDSFRSLVVHFSDQEAVDAFAQAIDQDFTSKAKFIWYPKQQRQDVADQRYMADEPALSDLHSL
jgi:ParB-like chromosome segregation protein Spo0J